MTETYLPPRQPPVPPWTGTTQNYLPPLPPQPPKRNRLRHRTVALLAAATLAAGGIGGTVGALIGDDGATATTTTATPTTATTDTATEPTDVSDVVARVAASVVQVNVTLAGGEGLGSGVIVGSDGRILTNNHVVAGAERITVTLADGRTVDATVEGTDPSSDLAVIQAQGVSGLTAATFADSDAVEVGDEVIAIGSPGGLQGTVTTGIVSALDREVTVSGEEQRQSPLQPQRQAADTVTYHAIQTDASINQGNSGGPLFDAEGRVIGINSAIYSPVSGPDGSAGSVGIGFAIPANTAQQLLSQL
ncbi:S1C family serine protease [Actinophytocola xanthii]|uniref:Peptidase S1 n=1 Tax=Actinophytocola xanthii TaxID=1912961 RepID=A0A1Q8CU64_9PSEU|nr:trypsin-like peptidase domain-containing protein [Actinophytocola xanthii]OLF17902.1 peptidase S1 [Actinophytocola xanthii]